MDVADFEKNFEDIALTCTSPIAVTRDGKLLGHYLPVWHLKAKEEDGTTAGNVPEGGSNDIL